MPGTLPDLEVAIPVDLSRFQAGMAAATEALVNFGRSIRRILPEFDYLFRRLDKTHLGYPGKGRPRPAATWMRPHRPPRRR